MNDEKDKTRLSPVDEDRRLIEEMLPIKEISFESSKEKNRRDGNLSTIHVWWARRPLIASRAGVVSSLLKLKVGVDVKNKYLELMKSICTWESSIDKNKITTARKAIRGSFPEPPKVLDCFAGGGAIPLEAMRLGCETYALDLNPVAHIIEKCTLYYLQKYRQIGTSLDKIETKDKLGNNLINDIRKGEDFILKNIGEKLNRLYPKHENCEVVSYLWAHSVACNNPHCGVQIPLIMQTWLRHSKNNKGVGYNIKFLDKKVEFEIKSLKNTKNFIGDGTIKRGNVLCPNCNQVMDVKFVREYATKYGYKDIPVALVYLKNGYKEFSVFSKEQIEAYELSEKIIKQAKAGEIPNEPLPPEGTLGFRVQRYGIKKWSQLFNQRQLSAILIFTRALKDYEIELKAKKINTEYIEAIITYLALAVNRLLDRNSIICSWNPHESALNSGNTFGRQAMPMIWDYAESNPIRIFQGAINRILQYIKRESALESIPTQVIQGSAMSLPFKDKFFDAIIIDPPYYDAVPYSDLSDFFYVWLKRSIGHMHKDVFNTPLSPKSNELIQEPVRHKNKEAAKKWYEEGMTTAYEEIYRTLKDDGISVTVFAHKSTDAWETLVNSLLAANFIVTASWPIETERPGRLRAQSSSALASSIFIVCRKRKSEEEGYFNEVKGELKERISRKLDQFWTQGIRGADFFISAIGPAVEVFGKYKKVKKLSGEEVGVAELLDLVREIVTDYSLQKILKGRYMGKVDDETRFYLLWRWAYDDNDIPYDDARKLAQALGIEADELLNRKDMLEKKGDKVNLMEPNQRKKNPHLGAPKGGIPAPMIDVIHKACLLWEKQEKEELKEFIENSGYSGDDSIWNVAQAISEVLPEGNKEKQLIQGLLVSKQSLSKEIDKEAAKQGKLNEFIK